MKVVILMFLNRFLGEWKISILWRIFCCGFLIFMVLLFFGLGFMIDMINWFWFKLLKLRNLRIVVL